MVSTHQSLTQNQFLVTHLRGTQRELTVAQARALYNIQNLRARVCELRKAGLMVRSRKNYRNAAAYTISSRLQNGSRAQVSI
jgi:hypothetical protein